MSSALPFCVGQHAMCSMCNQIRENQALGIKPSCVRCSELEAENKGLRDALAQLLSWVEAKCQSAFTQASEARADEKCGQGIVDHADGRGLAYSTVAKHLRAALAPKTPDPDALTGCSDDQLPEGFANAAKDVLRGKTTDGGEK